MNLDELQSVQARERQSSDLQHLRSSFYREVGEYVQSLTEERDELVERAEDPFSSPEVRQLTDDVETAEQTVEAIYERRVGKVVKKASIAAAGMPVDDDGLTDEEAQLFEDLVTRIERNRETVLAVLDGETPDLGTTGTGDGSSTASPGPSAEADPLPGGESPPGGESTSDAGPTSNAGPTSGSDGVSAADLMGGDEGQPDPESDAESDAEPEPNADADADVDAGANLPGEDGPADPGGDPLAADPDGSPTEVPPESGPPGATDSAPDERADTRNSDEGGDADPVDGGNDATANGSADGSPDGESRARGGGDDRDIPGLPRTTVRITADVGEVVGADDRDYDLGPEDVVTLPEPNADVLIEKDAAERLE